MEFLTMKEIVFVIVLIFTVACAAPTPEGDATGEADVATARARCRRSPRAFEVLVASGAGRAVAPHPDAACLAQGRRSGRADV